MNDGLARLYGSRFGQSELEWKGRVWEVLCRRFFQKYIRSDATVLDVGAGYCEFVNNIRCAKKYAVDANEDARSHAATDVEFHQGVSTDLAFLPDCSVDVAFMSNLLEHMDSKASVLATLAEVHRVLRRQGSLMILQPNIRYAYKVYWDFFDHSVPLSDRSLREALDMTGYRVETVIPRFLPYTTKTRAPRHLFLVSLYLSQPLLWRLFGKQMFVVAKKHV